MKKKEPKELKYYLGLVENIHKNLAEANESLSELYLVFGEINKKLEDEK